MFDVQQVVPKFGKTNRVFVDHGININGTYCCDVLMLTEQLLLVMREISGKCFIFQHDRTPGDSCLQWQGDTCFHFTRHVDPGSPYLNQVDYRIWGETQKRLYETTVHDIDELKQRMLLGAWLRAKRDQWCRVAHTFLCMYSSHLSILFYSGAHIC